MKTAKMIALLMVCHFAKWERTQIIAKLIMHCWKLDQQENSPQCS